jgi:VanZ family protein
MRFMDEPTLLPQPFVRPETTAKAMVHPVWRWLTWSLFLAAWTTALLTTFPVRVQESLIPPEGHFVSAKALHVGAYAFLAGFIAWLPIRGRWRWLLVAVLSLHAFATEFFQQFVEERTASLRDVGIDHVGILLGLLLTWRWLSPKS